MDRSKTNKCTGAEVYREGLRKGHSFSLGLHTTVFRAETRDTKVYIMENIEKGYIDTLSNSQAATNALDHFQTNSKLVKVAEHNGIQTVWVPEHMGIDGNETAHQLSRLDFSHSLTAPQSTLQISAKVPRGVIMGWMSSKHQEYLQSICG